MKRFILFVLGILFVAGNLQAQRMVIRLFKQQSDVKKEITMNSLTVDKNPLPVTAVEGINAFDVEGTGKLVDEDGEKVLEFEAQLDRLAPVPAAMLKEAEYLVLATDLVLSEDVRRAIGKGPMVPKKIRKGRYQIVKKMPTVDKTVVVIRFNRQGNTLNKTKSQKPVKE